MPLSALAVAPFSLTSEPLAPAALEPSSAKFDPHWEEYNPRWNPKWLFLGGFHHSGTTLIGLALSENARLSRKELPRENCTSPCFGAVVTGVKEDEGQHAQSVYPRGKEREQDTDCLSSWSEPLCPSIFSSPTVSQSAAPTPN